MKNKYNCISIVNLTKGLIMALIVVLSNLLNAQQATSIQTDVTFQWVEASQQNGHYPATIESITINGQVYNTFVVPSDYELTRLGPNNHGPNHIMQNHSKIKDESNTNDSGDVYTYGNGPINGIGVANGNGNPDNLGAGSPSWNQYALAAFQDKNLNHFFSASSNGREICNDSLAVTTTDAQKQTIFYNPSIPANEGGVLAITERNANNCFHVALFGTPSMGGPEQLLGATFVRPNNYGLNGKFFPPNQEPNPGTDYWKTDRTVESNKSLGMALFYLSDIVPIGSRITKIEFNASTNDHGDGKFLIMQKYAVDKNQTNCINEKNSGDLASSNNVPTNSTYQLISGPTPTGLDFEFNVDGTYSYTPPNGFIGDVTFDYRVCLPAPNNSVCDGATVTMTFIDLPENPTYTLSCGLAEDTYLISVNSPLGPEYEYSIDNSSNYQSSPEFNNLPEDIYNLVVKNIYTNCYSDYLGNPIIIDINLDLDVPSAISIEGCSASDITGTNAFFAYSNTQSVDIQSFFASNTDYNVSEEFDIESVIYVDTITSTNDCSIIVTRTFTVTDICGNTAMAIQRITVEDTTNPTITIPNDITIQCGEDESSSNTGVAEGNDLCGTVIITQSDIETAGACGDTKTITRTWTATDACGNMTSENQTITVSDTTPPVFDQPLPPATMTVECDDIPVFNTYTATDNCGTANVSFTEFRTNGDCPNNYTLTCTWTATDECNNQAQHVLLITVKDTTSPILTIPSNTTVECSESIDPAHTGNATAVDNCGTAIVSYSDSSVSICGNSKVITRTWTATDDCNNSISKIQTIDVVDTTDPTFNESLPSDITVTSDNIPSVETLTANDNCDSDVEVIFSETVIGNVCDASYTIKRNWIAEDDCGNDIEHIQTINIVHAVLTINVISVTDVNCYSESTGAIDIDVTGGLPPYFYSWSNGETSQDLTGISAGNYTITIEDSNGCTVYKGIYIKEPANPLSLIINKVNATSIRGCIDGTASAAVSGGTAPYSYEWSSSANNQTTSTATNLPIGIHSVVITDTNGCKTVDSIEITCTDDCDTSLSSGTTTNVSCFGDATGMTSVSASSVINPTATYTFTWSNGQIDSGVSSSSIINVLAGNYTVSVTMDGSVCDPVVQTITVSQPSEALSATLNKVDATSTQGCTDGTATVTVSGGTEPYTYEWSLSAGNQTTAIASNLPVGTHSVVVIDASGCKTVESVIIACTDDCDTAITTGTITNVLCFGDATGSTSVSASSVINPTATYTFTWSNGQTDTGVTSSSISNVIAGNYTVSVTLDGSTCDPVVQTVNIGQPNEDLSLTINKVNATSIQGCTDGSATALVSGGTSPYTYQWSASTGNQTSATASNLTVGDHTVIITDANNCTTTQIINITCTDDCDTAITLGTITNVLCFGDATGSTSVSASSVINPTATFTFTWSNGQIDAGVTSSSISNVIAGDYTVNVTMDGSVCDPMIQTITIAQPTEALSLMINKVNATSIQGCIDGTATAVASGGTAPFTYLWSASANNQITATATDLPAGNHSVVVTDANNCTTTQSIEIICTDNCDTALTVGTTTDVLCFGENTGATSVSASSVINPTATFTFTWSNGQTDTGVTSSSISAVLAGDYSVSVAMDGSVCDPVAQTVTIAQPTGALSLMINKVNATSIQGCIDGTATAVASGGTAPFTYLWSASTNNQTDATATDLPLGSHSVVVTDANNCTITQTISITCTDDCDTALTTGITTNILCFGEATGSTSVAASSVINPTANFTFTWSNGQTDTGVTSSSISNVIAGDYTVNVTMDGSVCDPIIQTITIAQPTETLSLTINKVNATSIQGCIDGTATAVASGGTAPFTYLWSASANNQITATATDLPAGNHSVVVTDANNCTTTQSIEIICTDNCDTALTVGTTTDVLCFGENTGATSVSASSVINPTATFTFTWSNGQTDTGVTSSSISNVIAGDYTVSVTLDGSVCDPVMQTITISQPIVALDATITSQTNTSCGSSDAFATVTPSGGTAPYTYQWNDPSAQTTMTASNLLANTYNVIVTDANGCTFNLPITIFDACITILKEASSVTSDCVGEGDLVTYTFTVTNPGDVSINAITITDDLLGGDITATLTLIGDNGDNILDPTETWIFTATDYTITQADVDAGNITNNVTIDGLEPDGTTSVQATDTYIIDSNNPDVTLCNESGIQLIKTGVFNNDNGNDCTEIDETITYTFTVTNNGDVALGNVIITDSLLDNATPAVSISIVSGDTDGDNQLDPNETWIYNATYLVTQVDIDTTEVINTAIVTATGVVNGTSVTDSSQTTTELIEDTTPPDTSTCAVLDETIECSGADNETIANDWNSANILALENCATDACDNNLTVTSNFDYENLISNCGAGGTITVIYTLTDTTGNASTFTAALTLEDTTGPDLSACTLVDETMECNGSDNENMATAWNATNIATLETCGTDTCDVIPTNVVTSDYDFTNLIPTCGAGGTITVIYTVSDDCGNTSTINTTLTIEDTTPPTFTIPVDITIECDVDSTDVTLTGDVTDEADNCDSGLEATYIDAIAAGNCANESIITRTWSLTDACDNSKILTQTITIQDTTPPIFTVPEDIIIECDLDVTDLTLTGDVTNETDNCDLGLEANYTDATVAGNCANESIITRTWTLADDCDNTTTLIQTITIQDTTPPIFTVPADITIDCHVDPTDLIITGEVTDESDNCSTGLEATFTDVTVDDSCTNSYIIHRTWTLEDECDNETTLIQTITVQDTTEPTFTVPADIILECDIDVTDLSITGDVTDETDNCSTGLEATYTDSITAGGCSNESIITRAWSLGDECGNTIVLIQTITVQDNTAPTFDVALPSDIVLECDAVPAVDTITATDNCGTATVTVEETTTVGSCTNEYTLIRVWTAYDDCGNETIHTQTITVEDTTAPSFNEALPADIDVECDVVPTAETLTAIDTCSTANVTFEETITQSECIGDYIIERTWTATDSCGNDAVHIQIITVQDTTAPTLVTPFDENITIACDDIPAVPDLVFEDSCSNDINVSFNEVSTQFNLFEDYEIIRTWTITDDCGNESQFVQTITVEINNVINASDANRCILDIEFDLFDLLSGDFDMDGTWSVVSGIATIDGSLFDPSTAEVGEYTFKYVITEGSCPIETEVTITIDDDCVVLACGEDNVVISKTVTANGDTINDVFEISGVDDCNFVIELQIFNRWGAEIYKNNNYQNNWGGEAHGSSVGNSGFVPTGTYYYIINLRNSGLKPFAGPIYLATNK